MRSNLKRMAALGLVLSLLGALLDFASGTAVLRGLSMMEPMSLQQTAIPWTISLYSLGIVLVITGLLGVSSVGLIRMRTMGFLMLLYGITMVGVGALMYEGYTPMMANTALLGLGMMGVGIVMLVNGVLMARRTDMMQTRSSSPSGGVHTLI